MGRDRFVLPGAAMILPPAQQASSAAANSLMQSVLDGIEERRREDEEKLKGEKKEDRVLKAWIQPDGLAKSTNAKINEHFFGALKKDEDPMAVMMARFTAAMGLTQAADESNIDFAQRLSDNLTLVGLITKRDAFDLLTPLTPARFRVSGDDISAILDGTAESPTPMAELMARFAARAGIVREPDEPEKIFNARVGQVIREARQQLPESVLSLEKSSGLHELGITARDMIAAIAQPYSEEAQAIKAKLDEKARADKTLAGDLPKVLQRLEQVADPKTLEELKVERFKRDPTRVEDGETLREREEDIRALEAADKLEDIEKQREAVKKAHEAANENPGGDVSTQTQTDAAVETIQVLAAGAAIAKNETAPADEAAGTAGPAAVAAEKDGAMSDLDQAVMLVRAGTLENSSQARDAAAEILTIHVDENGIYDYLARKKQESQAA